VFGLAIVVLALATLFVHPTPQLLPNGTKAPAITLRDTAGVRVVAIPSSGHRPVVVAFFETTCKTCQQKAAVLCTLAFTHPEVRVVAVDSGGADAGAAAAFASSHMAGCPVPFLLDADLAVSRSYAAAVVPLVYVIDSNGSISYSGVGAAALDALFQHIPR
jgi:peroxiredoxin